MVSKRIRAIIATVLVLLLIPLVAMQFTDEVNWNFPDFLIAGLLLSGTGLAIDLALRKIKKNTHRVVISIILLLLLFLIWAELAVGLFGLPFGGD